MKIEAVKFVHQNEAGQRDTCKLNIESGADVKTLKNEGPVVYVIRREDLSVFRNYEGAVFDCGEQRNRTELSRHMMGHSMVAIKLGHYKGVKTLKKAAVDLLKKHGEDDPSKNKTADENPEPPSKGCGVFIVGIDESLFIDLWNESCETKKYKEESKFKEGTYRWKGKPGDDRTLYGSTLNMMNAGAIPIALRNAYLGENVEVEFVRQRILQASGSKDTVLILGDTGTGKEIVARQIHKHRPNSEKYDFRAMNCAAVSPQLLESELFGHEKGAFTGAIKQKKGLWQTVGQGTLFLDEIGDLSLDHQAKILRALQEGIIRRVGGETEITVKARVVAATNRDLSSMVRSEQFRKDLFFRIDVLRISTPPLRNHLEDIPELTTAFWKQITQEEGAELPKAIITELQTYRWPGNVRELKGVLSDLYSLFRDSKSRLGIEHLRAVFRLNGQAPFSDVPGRSKEVNSMECLIHLSKIYDTIRASKFAMEPITKGGKTDPDTLFSVYVHLKYRLDELDMLCHHPERFHSPSAFDSVNVLKSKFMYFQSLLDLDIQDALRYWKESGIEALDHSMNHLKKTTEELREIA